MSSHYPTPDSSLGPMTIVESPADSSTLGLYVGTSPSGVHYVSWIRGADGPAWARAQIAAESMSVALKRRWNHHYENLWSV